MADPSTVLAVKPETFLMHWRDMRDAKEDADDRNMNVARAKKAAKRDGVDLDVVKLVEKLSKMEPDQRETYLDSALTYAKWLDLPLGAFGAGMEVPQPRESASEDYAKWKAGKDGKEAGLGGKPKDANPHHAGTKLYDTWARSWQSAFNASQKQAAKGMTKGTGAPRKGDNAANAKVVGKMAAAGEGTPASLN